MSESQDGDAYCCDSLRPEDLSLSLRRGMWCGPDRCVRRSLAEMRADSALRCAHLRNAAHEYDVVARFDQHAAYLRAQLLDFADLLEVAQGEGWMP